MTSRSSSGSASANSLVRAHPRPLPSTSSGSGLPTMQTGSTLRGGQGATRAALLTAELIELEDRLRQGGGADKIVKQHSQGKLTARERIALLLDPGAHVLEIGLLVAYDRYDGKAPAAGVVTVLGSVEDRPVVVIANDATVKAGSWWPETITKM